MPDDTVHSTGLGDEEVSDPPLTTFERAPVALDLRDHVSFDLDAPQLRPIARCGHLGLDLLCLEPQQDLEATTLAADRLFTVIGGRAWVVVDDAEVVLEPLQALLVPAGAAHGLRNDSADPLILQVVTAPPDQDHSLEASRASVSVAEAAAGRVADPAAASDRFARLRRLLGSLD